jgi:hypothetical protein
LRRKLTDFQSSVSISGFVERLLAGSYDDPIRDSTRLDEEKHPCRLLRGSPRSCGLTTKPGTPPSTTSLSSRIQRSEPSLTTERLARRSGRVMEAMLKMKKIDIAELKRAAEG